MNLIQKYNECSRERQRTYLEYKELRSYQSFIYFCYRAYVSLCSYCYDTIIQLYGHSIEYYICEEDDIKYYGIRLKEGV